MMNKLPIIFACKNPKAGPNRSLGVAVPFLEKLGYRPLCLSNSDRTGYDSFCEYPKLLLVNGLGCLLSKSTIQLLRQLIMRRVPILFYLHETAWAFNQNPELAAIFAEIALARSFYVLAVSEAQKKYLSKRFLITPKKIFVVGETADSPQITIAQKSGTNITSFFTVASIQPRKGFDLLADAAIALVAERPDVEFHWYGSVEFDQSFFAYYYDKIQSSAARARIFIHGFDGNVHNKIPLHDIFVLPSRDEPFAIAVLEAMAHAKPCIGFNVLHGGFAEQVGNSGIIVKLVASNALALALQELLDDKNRIQSLGIAAQKRYERLFHPKVFTKRLATIIRGIAK
jgi:glycosyltransferase involved in cell wall biosynthesis